MVQKTDVFAEHSFIIGSLRAEAQIPIRIDTVASNPYSRPGQVTWLSDPFRASRQFL